MRFGQLAHAEADSRALQPNPPALWEPNGGHAIGGTFRHDNAKQKHICFKHNAVISCLQRFFFEIIDIITQVDVDFLI
jgi:hypothetical protein